MPQDAPPNGSARDQALAILEARERVAGMQGHAARGADHEHRFAGLDRGTRQQPEGGGTVVHQGRRHAEVHPFRDSHETADGNDGTFGITA